MTTHHNKETDLGIATSVGISTRSGLQRGIRRTGGLEFQVPGQLLDIIWNSTGICGWNCSDCCVSAIHVIRRGDHIAISTPDLQSYELIPRDTAQGSIYDQALRHRQDKGLELTFDQKLLVLDHLAGHRVKLDVSGGDVLSPREGYSVLEAASARLGREYVTLTATGAGLNGYDILAIKDLIGELNFTYDGTPPEQDGLRPSQYAIGNLRRARQFVDAGVPVRAECPLTVQNVDLDTITDIYTSLHDAGVQKLLVMRLFPSGRGGLRPEDIPTISQYKAAIAHLRTLETKYGGPAVKLQCALRHLEGGAIAGRNPCDAVTESFGLMWDGTLLGSPWAIDHRGRPIDDAWVLGNLLEQPLSDVLASEKVQRMRGRAHENAGHCKFFSWTSGTSATSEDRIFELSDPMYTLTPGRVA